MALPSPKRRKVDHEISEDEDDNASFASFGESDETEEEPDTDMLDDALDEEEDEDEDEDDEEEGDDSWHSANEHPKQNGKSATNDVPSTSDRSRAASHKQPRENGIHIPGAVKNNAFQIQVDDLLAQIRPKHGKREAAAEHALHKLKSTIESLPSRAPLPVEEAERQLVISEKVATPFPHPRPPKDAKYKLEYKRPAAINVVGSHALKTRGRAKAPVEVDMTVTMPTSLFQDKDYLNHRYFYKRAYFIACVATGLQNAHRNEFSFRFEHAHDNQLQPILVVSSIQKDSKEQGKASLLDWTIRIMPCLAPDVFSSDKLQPDRNCVRSVIDSTVDKLDGVSNSLPTPLYNSSLRAEMLTGAYLKLMHSAAKKCPAFQDACLLGNTWLRQRGLSSDIHSGGFGNFELNLLMALMLDSGSSTSRPILSNGYSSYQLWKATLQVLAVKDVIKEPLILGSRDGAPVPPANGSPMVWDATRAHNIFFKMTTWSCKLLRHESRTTLNMLNDLSFDAFDAAFIQRSSILPLRYDYVFTLSARQFAADRSGRLPLQEYTALHDVLSRALHERVNLINVFTIWHEDWELGFTQPVHATDNKRVFVGFVVNPDSVDRTVDHGPSAEKKTEAASFRKLWGDKAELRRFKDGSIHESVVWSDSRSGPSILEQIVRHVIGGHFGDEAQHSIEWSGDGLKGLIPRPFTTHSSEQVSEAFNRLENDIRGLDDLPLSVRQIAPAGSYLGYTPTVEPSSRPADVIIQFEGSARWPDDLVAIQRTKMAFLLNVSRLLQASAEEVTSRVGLENTEHDILNQAFLDIVYESGAAFRLRIYHDREQTLLERKLKDKNSDPQSKELAALGLSKYKRDYLKAPALTQAIRRLCSRHRAMSGTIALLKKWFACHFLANHVADEVIQLFVAHTFTQPWPWQTPSSIQTGFLRTLLWISRWDWRSEPLIVDLSSSEQLKQTDLQSIKTRFEVWRKLDPLMNKVALFCASNIDIDGIAWTEGRPMKVVAARMTALSRAACAKIEEDQLTFDPKSLFSSPLSDFDFILHLRPELMQGKPQRGHSRSNGTTFKNLELQAGADASMRGYDPIGDFLHELQHLFGTAVVFFSAVPERPIISGLWDPQTAPRAWKLNLAYSTVPKRRSGQEEEVVAEINKDAMLAEMARLGGDMVERIEVRRG